MGHNYLGNSMYCRYYGKGGREEGIFPAQYIEVASQMWTISLVIGVCGVMIENDGLKQEESY